jgi:hypothetical protein
MSDVLTLDLVDEDSAVREALDEANRGTREELFRKAIIGGGAFLAGGLFIGGLPRLAAAQSPSAAQDTAILNFALTLEYLESEFYVDAVSKGALSGETLTFARTVRDHELAHVEALKDALGSSAVAKPTFDFKNTTSDAATFRATAVVLEDTGVSAYNGQGPNLRKATLPAAAAIVSVEARHAAWIRRIVGKPRYGGETANHPAPAVLDPALTRDEVLAAVTQTGFITG